VNQLKRKIRFEEKPLRKKRSEIKKLLSE